MFIGPVPFSVSKGTQCKWEHIWPPQLSDQQRWPQVSTHPQLRYLLQHCCCLSIVTRYLLFLSLLVCFKITFFLTVSSHLPLCQCNPFPFCSPSPLVSPPVFPWGCQYQPLHSCGVPVLFTVNDTASVPASPRRTGWQPPQVIAPLCPWISQKLQVFPEPLVLLCFLCAF